MPGRREGAVEPAVAADGARAPLLNGVAFDLSTLSSGSFKFYMPNDFAFPREIPCPHMIPV